MGEHTKYQMEYIESVDGCAHQSAVDIIGALEQQRDELAEIAEMLYRECLAERDCFYENCSTQDGEVPDADDRQSLVEIDAKLDKAMAVIDRYRQPQEAPELFPGTLEKLRGLGRDRG